MKNFFQILGIIMLFLISVLYTEKAVTVVRDFDDIMVKIKKEKHNYEQPFVDAIITGDEIIGGLSGKIVDENKSYYNMKKINQFNESLFEYKIVEPKISLKNNHDKYIISSNKDTISLVFIVKQDSQVLDVLDILNQKGVKATFFINSKWLENNNDSVYKITKNGNLLGNLDENRKNFSWSNDIIKKISKQEKYYCYNDVKNNKFLNICSSNKNYTIKPTIVVNNSPLNIVKQDIKLGSIISFTIDDLILDELGVALSYLKAKGYNIVTLDEQLNEK